MNDIHFAPAAPTFAPAQIESFRRTGCLIVPQFATPAMCAQLREAIMDYVSREDLIDVNLRHSRFRTFNGAQVDGHLPAIAQLYDRGLLGALSSFGVPLDTISDRRVGLSINVTPAGGHFQPHFDRNRVTAVLYVNDDFGGGDMQLFPRVRYWLGHSGSPLRRFMQRVLDKLVANPIYLAAFGRKVRFKPSAGTLVVFEGVLTLHQVMPVSGERNRISIQFAYDAPGKQYDVSDYYGLGQAR